MIKDQSSNKIPWWLIPLLIIGIPLLILLVVLQGLRQLVVCLLVALLWKPQHINGLILSSSHPAWDDWSKTRAQKNRLFLLNWNERKQWRLSLKTLVLYTFIRHNSSLKKDQGNPRKYFYPVAVVFQPWLLPKTVRFAASWQKAFKGNTALLHEQERLLDELAISL